ncbi:MAG: hypothetical protein QW767_00375 [Thermoprotei archaeon]
MTPERSVDSDRANLQTAPRAVVDSFSRRRKTRANAELVKRALSELKTGARISDIVKKTGLSDHVVKRHLTWLTAIREVYYEDRTGVYYSNNKVDHPGSDQEFTTESGRAYRLQTLSNPLTGYYVLVQEISRDSSGSPRVQGAIAIPLSEAAEILGKLGQAAQQFYNMTFITGEYK